MRGAGAEDWAHVADFGFLRRITRLDAYGTASPDDSVRIVVGLVVVGAQTGSRT
jgi:hypothetical protein